MTQRASSTNEKPTAEVNDAKKFFGNTELPRPGPAGAKPQGSETKAVAKHLGLTQRKKALLKSPKTKEIVLASETRMIKRKPKSSKAMTQVAPQEASAPRTRVPETTTTEEAAAPTERQTRNLRRQQA